MAYCCQPYSLHCLSWTFTGLHGWSFISQSLMNFEKSCWSVLPPLQRERMGTGEKFDFKQYFLFFYAANHNQQMKIILMHPLNSHRYVKLEELLEKSFPLVKMPSIQPIVMQVLKHLPKVWMCSVQWIIIIVVGCQIYFKIAHYTDRLIYI